MTRGLETAAQRWAHWKSTRSSSKSGRRPVTITEQRRLAQRESVKARKRNAAESRRRHLEQVKAAREAVQALEEFGARRIQRRIPAALLYLRSKPGGVWSNENTRALIRAILGRDPKWVRQTPYSRERKTRDIKPAKAMWRSDPDRIVLAISVDRTDATPDTPLAPFWQHGYVYYLRAHDFLSHFERNRDGSPFYLPAEAVSWQAVLAGSFIRVLPDLPVPSPRDVAHAIVAKWEELARKYEVPWDKEFLSAMDDQIDPPAEQVQESTKETPPLL